MSQQRSTVLNFAPKGAPLMAYPPGLPALDTDPIIIDSAADAVAVLAGLQWDALTPQQKEDARMWATLAAVALHPDGLRYLAYALTLQCDPPVEAPARRARVAQLMSALRGAASRMVGVANPGTSQGLADLIAADADGVRW